MPVLASLLGLLNSFRMMRLPDGAARAARPDPAPAPGPTGGAAGDQAGD